MSYLPLAMTGIDALQQWSKELEPSVMMPHYKHVLPYLNDYLKSSVTDGKHYFGLGILIHITKLQATLLSYKPHY